MEAEGWVYEREVGGDSDPHQLTESVDIKGSR